MFWNCLLRWRCKKILEQKVAQNVTIFLGYFFFSKSYNGHPEVTELAKNNALWSPCLIGHFFTKMSSKLIEVLVLVFITTISMRKTTIYWKLYL